MLDFVESFPATTGYTTTETYSAAKLTWCDSPTSVITRSGSECGTIRVAQRLVVKVFRSQ
jgi:hypothetical protein